MPSHPERVRRNYHKIEIVEFDQIKTDDKVISISISKRDIASAMSAREIEHNVFRIIRQGIYLSFGKRK